jgi:hypothetical protein
VIPSPRASEDKRRKSGREVIECKYSTIQYIRCLALKLAVVRPISLFCPKPALCPPYKSQTLLGHKARGPLLLHQRHKASFCCHLKTALRSLKPKLSPKPGQIRTLFSVVLFRPRLYEFSTATAAVPSTNAHPTADETTLGLPVAYILQNNISNLRTLYASLPRPSI